MKTKQLSQAQLLALSVGSKHEKELAFDFSRLERKAFRPVITGIQTYGIRNVESLTFCLDLYYDSYRSEFPSLKPSRVREVQQMTPFVEPTILAESAYRQIPETVDILIATVHNIVRATTSLNSIEFRSFLFKPAQLESLAEALSDSTTLTKIVFTNVPLFDGGFETVLRAFRRRGVREMTCSRCGLTDRSIESVRSLLMFHLCMQRDAEWSASLEIDGAVPLICLRAMNLSGNLFTTAFLAGTADVLVDLPMTRLNLTENAHVDEKDVTRFRKAVPHLNLSVNSGKKSRVKGKKGGKKRKIEESSGTVTYSTSVIKSNDSVNPSSTIVNGSGSSAIKGVRKRALSPKPRTTTPVRSSDSMNPSFGSATLVRSSDSAAQVAPNRRKGKKKRPRPVKSDVTKRVVKTVDDMPVCGQTTPNKKTRPNRAMSASRRPPRASTPTELTDDSSDPHDMEIELAPGVRVVGKRASAFAHFIEELCAVANGNRGVPAQRHRQ